MPLSTHTFLKKTSLAFSFFLIGFNITPSFADLQTQEASSTKVDLKSIVFGRSSVGANGTLLHYEKEHWVSQPNPLSDTSIGLHGGDNGYIVGENGTILQYINHTWKIVDNPISNSSITLNDIHSINNGPSAHGSETFAVGQNGFILHQSQGNLPTQPDWVSMTNPVSGTSTALSAVWMPYFNTAYVVGDNGTILHLNGDSWTLMDNPLSNSSITLRDIWGASNEDIFAVGDEGTVLHYDGNNWTAVTIPDLDTTIDFNSVRVFSIKNNQGVNYIIALITGSNGTFIHYDSRYNQDWSVNTDSPVYGSSIPFIGSLREPGDVSDDILLVSKNGAIFRYKESVFYNHPITVHTPGDENGDGSVNITDVISVINLVLNGNTEKHGGDCNQDDAIDILDITCTINIILTY